MVVAEITTPQHFAEIVDAVRKGFIEFKYIGGASALLTKEPLPAMDFDVQHMCHNFFRATSSGDSLKISTPEGDQYLVYNSVKKDE